MIDPYNSRGYSNDRRTCRYISEDYSVRTNLGPLAHSNRAKYLCSSADKYIILDRRNLVNLRPSSNNNAWSDQHVIPYYCPTVNHNSKTLIAQCDIPSQRGSWW